MVNLSFPKIRVNDIKLRAKVSLPASSEDIPEGSEEFIESFNKGSREKFETIGLISVFREERSDENAASGTGGSYPGNGLFGGVNNRGSSR